MPDPRWNNIRSDREAIGTGYNTPDPLTRMTVDEFNVLAAGDRVRCTYPSPQHVVGEEYAVVEKGVIHSGHGWLLTDANHAEPVYADGFKPVQSPADARPLADAVLDCFE